MEKLSASGFIFIIIPCQSDVKCHLMLQNEGIYIKSIKQCLQIFAKCDRIKLYIGTDLPPYPERGNFS